MVAPATNSSPPPSRRSLAQVLARAAIWIAAIGTVCVVITIAFPADV
jgi:hypothetical protein